MNIICECYKCNKFVDIIFNFNGKKLIPFIFVVGIIKRKWKKGNEIDKEYKKIFYFCFEEKKNINQGKYYATHSNTISSGVRRKWKKWRNLIKMWN